MNFERNKFAKLALRIILICRNFHQEENDLISSRNISTSNRNSFWLSRKRSISASVRMETKGSFNDMLGSTLNIGGKAVNMTAFGESADNDAMYTGKPYIGELGYAFLFRNYRADQGKWQTTDPLGYPDGWNNLAYGNNQVFSGVDLQGTVWVYDTHNVDFEATTMKDFSSGNGYYIVTFPTPDWWYMVIYQVDRAQYIEQMVQASCPHADPYKYTAPDNSYNVSVNVSWVKSVYSYGDAFNGNGGLINVDVYSVVSTWRVKGTYQTRRWVEE